MMMRLPTSPAQARLIIADAPMRALLRPAVLVVTLATLPLALLAQPEKPDKPLDRAAAKWVEQTLKAMTLDEKIGQMLVTSLNASFTAADSDAFAKLQHLV